jgi:hypothetical protein
MGKLSVLWNDYQEYKGIKLYPFLMNDYELFEILISVLLYKKNQIPNIDIIKMSYLKFLLFVLPKMIDENKEVLDIDTKTQLLLTYVLKNQAFDFFGDENGKIFIKIKVDLKNEVILNEKDFDDIKNIILTQNAISIVDNKLHPDLQQELEDNIQFLAKLQGNKDGDISEQVISYKCKMGFESYKPIKEMTVYQFRKELARLDLITDYQIYKTAEMSGMVTFKKPIPHWHSHISDTPDYSGLLMSKEEFESKMKEFSK